jgi:hypothetical protein
VVTTLTRCRPAAATTYASASWSVHWNADVVSAKARRRRNEPLTFIPEAEPSRSVVVPGRSSATGTNRE